MERPKVRREVSAWELFRSGVWNVNRLKISVSLISGIEVKRVSIAPMGPFACRKMRVLPTRASASSVRLGRNEPTWLKYASPSRIVKRALL